MSLHIQTHKQNPLNKFIAEHKSRYFNPVVLNLLQFLSFIDRDYIFSCRYLLVKI